VLISYQFQCIQYVENLIQNSPAVKKCVPVVKKDVKFNMVAKK